MESSNSAIGQAIRDAQPVNAQGENDPYADRRVDKYAIENGALCLLKPAFDRVQKIPVVLTLPLANFAARLVEETALDDGLDVKTAFVVEGRTADGKSLAPVTVPATAFTGMGWVTQSWGARAILAAGPSVRDNARAAIQVLSGPVPRRVVYQHTGWRKLGGEWLYLTGPGAVGKDGLKESVAVDLGHGHISKYHLPAPPLGPRLQVAAGAILDLLSISPARPELGAALLACAVRAALGEAHRIDFALFLQGRTGAQKSEGAALIQACFGAGFDARGFPAGWTDTPSDLEHKSHQAKDAVFVVDDFAPSVNAVEAAKLHGAAERLFRSVGNQAGRGRRNCDMSAKPAYHPRGLIVATGEDLPRGASLLGRLLIIEVRRGDVDLGALSRLQDAARDGRLAECLAAFLQWLAPRMDDLKSTLPALTRRLRDTAIADGYFRSHPRAPDMFASLQAGVETFLDFAYETRALAGCAAAHDLPRRVETALRLAFQAQGEYIAEQDEVARFLALLRACLASGNAHVADHLNQGPPSIRSHAWGWRNVGGDQPKGMGDLIGWVNEPKYQAWLNPEAAWGAVQRMAAVQGNRLLIQPGTLWRRLHERGLLLVVEPNAKTGRPRVDPKQAVAGRKVRVLVMASKLFDDPDEDPV